MGTPRKVDVLIAQFCYAGNGGVATVLPDFVPWMSDLMATMRADERIGRRAIKRYGDVPLTMERNRVVRDAIAGQFDIIIMLDSDNRPDLYLGHDPRAKPFWDSSFDFMYPRLCRDLPTVVCAPYCGPPPDPVRGGEENVYVFHFQDTETDALKPSFSLKQYSRTHADQMAGIQPVDAGPTGVIIYTTSAFDLMRFDRRPTREILEDFRTGKFDHTECERRLRQQSYFWYEFTDGWQTQKSSTEDVTNTREIGMAGHLKYREPVLFCNWDSWAGHLKPKCVGRPRTVRIDQVNGVYRQAVLDNLKDDESIVDAAFTDFRGLPPTSVDFRHPTGLLPIEESAIRSALADDGPPSGVPIKYRMICGRKMASVGHVTPDNHLNALTLLTQQISQTLKRPMRMLEVGSWVGESAVALLGGTLPGSEIYCVDTWEGSASDWTGHLAAQESPMDWFVKNCGELIGESVRPIKGPSIEVADSFGDSQQLDLIFLDGDHAYESVKADIEHWQYHLANGGILCGHDYCEAFPGVIQAVDEYCKAEIIPGTTIWYTIHAASFLDADDHHHPV